MLGRGALIFTTVVVLFLTGGAVAVYAYDSARDDLIAQGVTVAGVNVGGLRVSRARERIAAEVAADLERPVEVTTSGRRFGLSADRVGLRADVEGMVQGAIRKSRQGNVLSRAVRDLRGGTVNADVPARVTWSRDAVARFVRRIKRRVDRPARDATVQFSAVGLAQAPSRDGLAVRGAELERRINEELGAAGGDRAVTAGTKVVKPAVTTDQLAAKYPYAITVSRGSFELRFFKGLKLARTYRVAVGAVGFETPAGLYHVQNKAVNPAWHVPKRKWAGKLAGTVVPGGTPENPLKARWLGIYNGAGIHGTDADASIGSRASHGCIRMRIPDVIELYEQVPVQTPVYIG